jgi:hypothetical protein
MIGGMGEQTPREDSFLEAADEESDLQFALRRGAFFMEIMNLLIQELHEKTEIELQQFIARMGEYGRGHWLDRRSFYDFWLILHQRSPVRVLSMEQKQDNNTGLEDVFGLLGHRVLVVCECSGIVETGTRYQIQNMKLKWGDEQGEL